MDCTSNSALGAKFVGFNLLVPNSLSDFSPVCQHASLIVPFCSVLFCSRSAKWRTKCSSEGIQHGPIPLTSESQMDGAEGPPLPPRGTVNTRFLKTEYIKGHSECRYAVRPDSLTCFPPQIRSPHDHEIGYLPAVSVCPPFEHSESSEWLSRSDGVSVVPLETNKSRFQFPAAREPDATPS